jgi:hypothetical protein
MSFSSPPALLHYEQAHCDDLLGSWDRLGKITDGIVTKDSKPGRKATMVFPLPNPDSKAKKKGG